MDSKAEFNDLIGLLYDSVLDDRSWTSALEALVRFTGGTGAGEVIADPEAGTITQCATLNIAPEFKDLYLGYYASKEVRLPPAVGYGVGTVMTEGMLLERRELQASEIYNDLLRPFEVPHFMFAWLRKAEKKVQTLAIEGTIAHGAFDDPAVGRLAAVMPHLIRTVRMREHMIAARNAQHVCREVLETLPFGIAVLDETARVIELTTMAESVVLGRALTLRQRRIHATDPDDDNELQAVLRSAITPAPGRPVSAGTVAVRRFNASALKVTVTPISAVQFLSVVARPSALVIVVDPDKAPAPESALVQAVMGLTKSEAALAHALFAGKSLRDAARDLGRSVNTCKAQLKSIYAKTGCHTHVELAKSLVMAALGERPSNTSQLRF